MVLVVFCCVGVLSWIPHRLGGCVIAFYIKYFIFSV